MAAATEAATTKPARTGDAGSTRIRRASAYLGQSFARVGAIGVILKAMPDREPELNVLGGPLEPCGTDPLTGFYRDGCCSTGPEDRGRHTICAVVTAEFLEHQRSIGNDLLTPVPEYRFPACCPATVGA